MSEQIEEVQQENISPLDEEIIEDNAEYWAGRVSDVLAQTEEEVTTEAALETLAVLDADANITDHYDADEFDLFLDEFEEAIEDQEEKDEVFEDHVKNAKKDNTEDDNDNQEDE